MAAIRGWGAHHDRLLSAMAIRTFHAPDGGLWNVWEVSVASSPVKGSRRVRERRGQDLLLYKGPERRVAERRRGSPGLSLLPSDYAGGWLVFESGGEKRRLAPPPAGWAACPDERLIDLWRRAREAGGKGPPRDRGIHD